ncbi:hypothetical protein [Geodermatophilus ruber]|uniref:YGGT family protein n=1 Tax=Geodermatophilus ruber TaxID=504800 RepID=A0A1I4D4Z5_9ACTN|nr:hypothetical protein [Geodermatophilus ruber]SFK87081.1 hypothetical protein SAMN04488085_104119 [Geodermatophilus ruber]
MARAAATRAFALLASVVRLVASLIAAVIVLHAVFWFFEANPDNALVSFAAEVRETFGWFTVDLFRPEDAKLGETINAALAALVYVVVGNLLSKLIVRLAPGPKARV